MNRHLAMAPAAVPGLVIRPPDEIEFSAIIHARSFVNGWTMPGYHAIVWKSGNARATIRDYVEKKILFTLRPGILPPDRSLVSVVLRRSEPPKNRG